MYTRSTIYENVHINNEGDAALLEAFDWMLKAGDKIRKDEKDHKVHGLKGNLTELKKDLKNVSEARERGDMTGENEARASAKKHAVGAGKSAAAKVAGAAVLAAGHQAYSDYVNTGDPLHTAKKIKADVDEKIEKAKQERERKKNEKEYVEWKKNMKKSLKEDCQFFIDEAAGTAYYAYTIDEAIAPIQRLKDHAKNTINTANANNRADNAAARAVANKAYEEAKKAGKVGKYTSPWANDSDFDNPFDDNIDDADVHAQEAGHRAFKAARAARRNEVS